MANTNPLAARERALEDAFFRKESERLLDAMRKRESRKEDFDALATALGISDARVLDPLLDLGVQEQNVAALSIAPLVAVAWADRNLDNEERRLILAEERQLGIEADSEAGQLLATWLDHRPHESLIETWCAYIGELRSVLSEDDLQRLHADVKSRASRIAHALEKSFLRGSGPVPAEVEVLEKIDQAFGA